MDFRKQLKLLNCYLFHHTPVIVHNYFTDIVEGKQIHKYECVKCHKQFMASGRWSTFRVHTFLTKMNESYRNSIPLCGPSE